MAVQCLNKIHTLTGSSSGCLPLVRAVFCDRRPGFRMFVFVFLCSNEMTSRI